MKTLVIGGSGQVGRALVEELSARGDLVVATYFSNARDGLVPLDLGDAASVEALIRRERPDAVFCPGALTHVDRCEREPDLAREQLVSGPYAAARAAASIGAAFVHFSTDYVFDGGAGPYGEDDAPNPLSVYGRLKLESERAVALAHPGALIIRTAIVYGVDPQEKNSVYQIVRALRAGKPFSVFVDQLVTPTPSDDLARAAVELSRRGERDVVHVVGSERLSRRDFARCVCDAFDLDASLLVPVETAAVGFVAPRPLNGGLRIDRLRRLLGWVPSGLREGLSRMRRRIETKCAGGA